MYKDHQVWVSEGFSQQQQAAETPRMMCLEITSSSWCVRVSETMFDKQKGGGALKTCAQGHFFLGKKGGNRGRCVGRSGFFGLRGHAETERAQGGGCLLWCSQKTRSHTRREGVKKRLGPQKAKKRGGRFGARWKRRVHARGCDKNGGYFWAAPAGTCCLAGGKEGVWRGGAEGCCVNVLQRASAGGQSQSSSELFQSVKSGALKGASQVCVAFGDE
jgi:hypothetical protein